MICDVGMVTDGGRGPEMFLEPFPKGPCTFPFAVLITFQSVTLVPVDYSAFLCDAILILGEHLEVSDGVTSLKGDLDLHFATDVFEAFA